MSFCYEMLYEIKKGLGENGKQEYINHINLLRIIKEEIEEERQKFTERIQGAEVSLFIENVFAVYSKESKPIAERSDLGTTVEKVLEKKNMIEKLQEKMNQRLDIINNLLANHVNMNTNVSASTTPNIVKNNIRFTTVHLHNQAKAFDWSKAFTNTKRTPMKAKKGMSKMKASFKEKRYTSFNKESSRTNSTKTTTEKVLGAKLPFHVENLPVYKMASNTVFRNSKLRKGSIDGLKSLANQFFEPSSDVEEETPMNNIRLYHEPKNTIGSAIMSSKKSHELSVERKSKDSQILLINN